MVVVRFISDFAGGAKLAGNGIPAAAFAAALSAQTPQHASRRAGANLPITLPLTNTCMIAEKFSCQSAKSSMPLPLSCNSAVALDATVRTQPCAAKSQIAKSTSRTCCRQRLPPMHIHNAGVRPCSEQVRRTRKRGAAHAALIHGTPQATLRAQVPGIDDAVAACIVASMVSKLSRSHACGNRAELPAKLQISRHSMPLLPAVMRRSYIKCDQDRTS